MKPPGGFPTPIPGKMEWWPRPSPLRRERAGYLDLQPPCWVLPLALALAVSCREIGCAPALMSEIALSPTYPRYGTADFERRWQERLNTPLPRTTSNPSQLHVEVKHRFPGPNRYSWELRRARGLPVQESTVQFRSWEEASQAGTLALKLLLQDPLELKKLGLS